jgi:hypothetical protein
MRIIRVDDVAKHKAYSYRYDRLIAVTRKRSENGDKWLKTARIADGLRKALAKARRSSISNSKPANGTNTQSFGNAWNKCGTVTTEDMIRWWASTLRAATHAVQLQRSEQQSSKECY